MKKTVLWTMMGMTALIASAVLPSSAFAATTQTWDPSLKQANSCADVDAMLKERFNNYWDNGYFGPVARDGAIMNNESTKSALMADGIGGGGGGADFSTTNNQKTNVQEPDIVKNNGKSIFYVDSSNNVVRILDVTTQKELSSLQLPNKFQANTMFLTDNKLILLGYMNNVMSPAYYETVRFIQHGTQSAIMIYDINSATKPVFVQGYLYDGRINESRVVDNNLIVTTQTSMGWSPIYTAVYDMVQKNTTKSVKKTDFNFKAQDILPQLTTFTYSLVTPKTGKPRLIENKQKQPIDCTQVLYPAKQKVDENSQYKYANAEGITSILSISLDNVKAKPIIKTAFVNNSQIHVSDKSIYLTAPTYFPTAYACPAVANVFCTPWTSASTYTTVYKFGLKNIDYRYATLVEGTTYSQYSMDENTNGVMRIVTSEWEKDRPSTNVYTIDTAGKILGSLQDIAPGENFYGTRFIDNYLYLVTYKQIDPLFVVDLSNSTKPTIVGELKMPGYSSYLHPYGPMKNGIQYLIGLGYDTKTLEGGQEQVNGIKLDLYKIDFTKKNAKGEISVAQAWTKTFGEQGSQTDALYNPRMFMFNDKTKDLMLPLVMTKTKSIKTCYTTYNEDGSVASNDCNKEPVKQLIADFAGIKVWNVSETALTEKLSIDYKDTVKQPNDYMIDPMNLGRYFQSLNSRVGYNGSTYYMVNSQFAQFFTAQTAGNKDNIIFFDTSKK